MNINDLLLMKRPLEINKYLKTHRYVIGFPAFGRRLIKEKANREK